MLRPCGCEHDLGGMRGCGSVCGHGYRRRVVHVGHYELESGIGSGGHCSDDHRHELWRDAGEQRGQVQRDGSDADKLECHEHRSAGANGRDNGQRGGNSGRRVQQWSELHGNNSSHGADYDEFGSQRTSGRCLFNNDPGEWGGDAVQLEYKCGGAAGRFDALGIERDDLGNADDLRFIQLHRESDRFNFADSTNGNEVLGHCGGTSSRPSSSHDEFPSCRASRGSLFGDTPGKRGDDAVQLEYKCGSAAGRSDSLGVQRDYLGNADGLRFIQLHRDGDGFNYADSTNGNAVLQHHGRCGGDPFGSVELGCK